jgi:hypothetical protein
MSSTALGARPTDLLISRSGTFAASASRTTASRAARASSQAAFAAFAPFPSLWSRAAKVSEFTYRTYRYALLCRVRGICGEGGGVGSTRSIPVSGTCPKCHQAVTKDSPAGKVTWRGTCPKRGCGGYVVCRRVKAGAAAPADQPAAGPDEPQQPEQQPARAPKKAVKVNGYQGRQPGRQPRTDPEVRPTDAGNGQPTDGEPEPDQRAARRRPEPETGRTGRHGSPYGDLFGWDG